MTTSNSGSFAGGFLVSAGFETDGGGESFVSAAGFKIGVGTFAWSKVVIALTVLGRVIFNTGNGGGAFDVLLLVGLGVAGFNATGLVFCGCDVEALPVLPALDLPLFCLIRRLQLANERDRHNWRSTLENISFNSVEGEAACEGEGVAMEKTAADPSNKM